MELRNILEIFWRRKWIIVNVFTAIFLIIFVGTLVITPWYDATSKVLLKKSSSVNSVLVSLGFQSASGGDVAFTETDRADYLALSTVRPIIDRVIVELDVRRERIRGRIIRLMPFLKPILIAMGVKIVPTETMTAEVLLESSILSNIFPRPNLSVEQYEETDILEIEAKSPDPEQAMKISNAVAKAFIDEETRRIQGDYARIKQLIHDKIDLAKSEYTKALQAVSEFKEKGKFVSTDTETTNLVEKITVLKKEMEDSNLSLIKTKASILKIESQLKSIPMYRKTSEQIKDNEMITSLKMTLRDLYLSLAESKSKYTQDHPNVVDIENKISQAKELMQKEMQKVFGQETIGIDSVYQNLLQNLAGFRTDISGYEAQNKAYPKAINNLESEMMALPRKSSTLTQLQSLVTVSQSVYENLLKYQHYVGIAESLALSNIYIVEHAIIPDVKEWKHRHPSFVFNTVLAILLGVMFGLGAGLLLEYLDDSIRTLDDMKAFKEIAFLGSIFKLNRHDPRRISEMNSLSPITENFRTVRNRIKLISRDHPPKSFMITSSIDKEGKSFLVSNLALSFAHEGKKVLVIDGNLRNPGIHAFFHLSNGIGLTHFLNGETDVDNIQIPSGVEGLTIIPSGPMSSDPAKWVESEKMRQLIADMKAVYDVVIVDTPPLLSVSDALILGGWVDGTIILIESERMAQRHFRYVIESVRQANIPVIGVVLNKVSRQGCLLGYETTARYLLKYLSL
jgi:capsular exopolysaccharide synthesis family protein